MPYQPKKPCRYPGCPELTNDSYCEMHKKLTNQQYNKYQRDEFSKNFYNTPRWVAKRKGFLQLHPFCQECLKGGVYVKATLVDHIVPIKQGGDPFADDNLQGLCWSCHSRKSIKEGSRFGNHVQARQ